MPQYAWSSPSNIALVKYWGKHPGQLPANPSLSLTLSQAATHTRLVLHPRTAATTSVQLAFYFEGQRNDAFGSKTLRWLQLAAAEYPFLLEYDLEVHTHNTFPHSAGIASSASGMSAIALCLLSAARELHPPTARLDPQQWWQRASHWARLGSGSACRSVYATAAVWGHHAALPQSSDQYAVPVSVDSVFHTYHDSILIVSADPKAVSSSAGHQLMEGNPYAPARYQQAHSHLETLLSAMQQADLDTFGRIVESEALTLHALMMSSQPPYVLLHPSTLVAIGQVQAFRRDTGHPLYFTLDAGPNLHLLYPDYCAAPVQAFVEQHLRPLCADGRVLHDRVGSGPQPAS